MRRIPRNGRARRLAVTALTILALLPACSRHEPTPVANALVHLPFEGTLENWGSATLTGEAMEGDAHYKKSPDGRALHPQGDGSWIEFNADFEITPGNRAEIAFELKREDWTNPYEKGSATQTVIALSGKTNNRIEHLTFGFNPSSSPTLYASFKDQEGEKHRLITKSGALTLDWHQVRLAIDRIKVETTLYFDDEQVARAAAVPNISVTGINRIKLGTWHKQNQAFRGLIDYFVIADLLN